MKKVIGYVMAGCLLILVVIAGYLVGQQPSKQGSLGTVHADSD
jgi:hypothetical protein